MGQIEYIILDAARMDGLIFKARELNERHICLYEGDSEKFLGTVAPWLFRLERDSEFSDWILKEGLQKKWGIVIITAIDQEALYAHLRKFLIINTDQEKELYFRYYEPQVMQAFLPTCDAEHLLEFFGPVQSFVVESAEGSMLEFRLKEGKLNMRDLDCNLNSYLLSSHATSHSDNSPNSASQQGAEDKWDFGF
jgi:hypothetical protein